MTRTRVKICGLTRLEDAECAVACGADAVGFVLWPKSPRGVDVARARSIASALPPFVTRVGVFVNASPDDVRRAVDAIGLDVAQLHGDEPAEAYASTATRLMKVVPLERDADVHVALGVPRAITVLVDTADRERRGGTGERANWQLASRVAARRPIVLAGGVSAANVAEAIAVVRPWGLDVSSGVEDRPGVKSRERMRDLFEAVRAAEGRGPEPKSEQARDGQKEEA